MLMEHKRALEQNHEMLKVLLKVQEDVNWMTNSNKCMQATAVLDAAVSALKLETM
jgi:hypothetical protein